MTAKGLKRCCMSNAVDGIDDDKLWNGIKEDGNVTSVRKRKALNMKMRQ